MTDGAFMIASFKPWNMLPANARNACPVNNFKTLVKIFLFKEAFSFIYLFILVLFNFFF